MTATHPSQSRGGARRWPRERASAKSVRAAMPERHPESDTPSSEMILIKRPPVLHNTAAAIMASTGRIEARVCATTQKLANQSPATAVQSRVPGHAARIDQGGPRMLRALLATILWATACVAATAQTPSYDL